MVLKPAGRWGGLVCEAGERVTCVAVGSDGKTLWVATTSSGEDKAQLASVVRAWRVVEAGTAPQVNVRHVSKVQRIEQRQYDVVGSEVGALIAHAGHVYAACSDGALWRFSETPNQVKPRALRLRASTAAARASAGTRDSGNARFDYGNGVPILALEVERRAPTLSWTGRQREAMLLTASQDGTVRALELPLRWIGGRHTMHGHTGAVRALAVVCVPPSSGLPGALGRMVMSGGDDASVRVWSLCDGVRLGTCLTEMPGLGAAVTALRGLNDGRAVASLSSGALLLLEVTPPPLSTPRPTSAESFSGGLARISIDPAAPIADRRPIAHRRWCRGRAKRATALARCGE